MEMHDIAGHLAIIGIYFILLIPWILLALSIFKEQSILEKVITGIVGGIAANITLCYLHAMFHGLHLYIYSYFLILLLSLSLFLFNAISQNILPWKQQNNIPIDLTTIWFLLALCSSIAAEAIPTFSTTAPLGWDPSFHSILAQKILHSNSLIDNWQPFEKINLNYPLGMHVLIALIAKWSHQEVYQVFQTLHMLVQIPAAILIYLLSIRIFNHKQAAIFAMLSYAFLCHWGSFRSYYQWGGLPTEFGMLFFLTLIWSFVSHHNKKSMAFGVLLFGSIILVHHLSAVISSTVMGFYILMNLTRRKLDTLSFCFLILFPLTFIAYSFFIVPYTFRIREIEGTGVLKFHGESIIPLLSIPDKLGYLITGLGIVGLALSFRKIERSEENFLICWLTSLLLSFCLLDYVYRFFANYFFQENFTAFTPSRFLTVLSYPLALYAGHALQTITTQGNKILSKMKQPAKVQKMDITFSALFVTIVLLSIPDIKNLIGQKGFSEQTYQLGQWIKQNTPENGFIIYLTPIEEKNWLPYLTWRPTVYTPIPVSENSQMRMKKLQLFHSPLPPEKLNNWLREEGFQGFVLQKGKDAQLVLTQIL